MLNSSKSIPPPQHIDRESQRLSAIPNGRWKRVVKDRGSHWIACWKHPLPPNKIQYVYMSMSSEPRTERDRKKYILAERLHAKLPTIRKTYLSDLRSSSIERRQIAAIVYLIDMCGLRVGHSKDEKTFGASTLKRKHIMLKKHNQIHLNFLGKDSMRFERVITAPKEAIQVIEESLKSDHDDIFHAVNANMVNAYLEDLMEGLTAKVFRTRACTEIVRSIMEEFDGKKRRSADPLDIWVKANEQVAMFCNHVRVIDKDTVKYSLTTSAKNYINPMLVYSFALKHKIDPLKMYSKGLNKQFSWALEEAKRRMRK